MFNNEKRKKKEYSIGEVGRKFGLSLKTMRYYDELGLVKPSRRDERSGYRYYDEDVALRLASIKYYQATGLTLEEIRDFIFSPDLDSLIAKFDNDICRRQKRIKNEIINKETMAVWLDLLEEGRMYLQMEELPLGLKRIPRIEAVYSYNNRYLGEAWRAVGQVPYGSIYVEYPHLDKRIAGTEQDYIRYMKVHPDSNRHIQTSFIGDFTAVSAIHIGSRQNIANTYHTMVTWSKENGFSLKNTCLERYIIDETSVNREAEFVTEVLIPLKNE